MANGILIVDKPAGWTSQDVVSKLRGVFHERRAGHGGTLDPMATGVLPVFFGRATRAVEFFEHAEKAYLATLRLGTVTDTQDTSGTVLQTSPVEVTEAQLRNVLEKFLGEIEQIPPMYSAIKVGGKKLYELARSGKEIERKPRRITVFSIELRDFDGKDALIYIRCSKGTYVRTLCHDIGAELRCGGFAAALAKVEVS
ncbi:MAG: tRNA pseudouridine(55) synthase TruB, partial [Clostridiales bacterium]|nr:tRNA pseudouridine(55) synthase TruB [Clostridiales bacterium]